MDNLKIFIDEIIKVKKNIKKDVGDMAMLHEDKFISVVQDRLYNKGEYADGSVLRPYSFSYIATTKKPKNAPFDRTTLLDTGSFYKGMFLSANKNVVSLFSKDPKTSDILYGKFGYGKKVFDYSEKEQEHLVKTLIEPSYEKIVLSKLEKMINIELK